MGFSRYLANITVALVATGVDPGPFVSDLAAVGGLVWIAVARATDEPQSSLTALAAATVAVLVIVAAVRACACRPGGLGWALRLPR